MKPVISSFALLFFAAGLPGHGEEAAPATPEAEPVRCATLSAGAQTFLDGLIAEMLDPESSFSHLPYLGEPEMGEIRDLDKERLRTDWGNLCKYVDDNQAVMAGDAPDVVFLGDSITEFWSLGDPQLFSDGRVNRGISGQTSSQMLVRFWPDIVALKPGAVHIMAGTNDLAENTGYVSDEAFKGNIQAMVTLAQSHDIAVILASIPPAGAFGWRAELDPPARIAVLNQWLEDYAAETGAVYADYHSLLSTDGKAMSPDYTHDGVHPHSEGYAAIRDAAEAAIARALDASPE